MKTENLTCRIYHQNLYKNDSKSNNSVTKTTAGENPSGRLSFKGRADVAAKLSKNAVGKLVNNKSFNWFLDVVNKNSLLADALVALGLTAVARPALIYAIPSKDEVEKKKNNYQVAHSVATGVLGLATTYIVSNPISDAVKKVVDNPGKYMKKDFAYVLENKGKFMETAKRVHQPFFLPLRAILTIMLVKPLLETLGLSKNGKANIKPQDKAKIDYSFMCFKGSEKNMFNKFSKINALNAFAKDDSVKTKTSKNNSPSFKGRVNDKLVNGIAKNIIGKMADSKGFQKFFNWFKDKKDWFPHLIAAESLWLSSFYMMSSGTSKKIEKDQKLPMILNQGITAVLCTIGAYKLDGVVNKKLARLQTAYKLLRPEMDQNLLKNRLRGIRLLGPVLIFTTIYRFVGPVVVTPIANKISEMIQPHKKSAKQQPQMATAK